jgi:hypothetical protein
VVVVTIDYSGIFFGVEQPRKDEKKALKTLRNDDLEDTLFDISKGDKFQVPLAFRQSCRGARKNADFVTQGQTVCQDRALGRLRTQPKSRDKVKK